MSNDIFPLKSQVDQGDPAPSSPSGQCSKSSPETGSGLSANVPIAPPRWPKFRVWDGERMTVPDDGEHVMFFNDPRHIEWGLYSRSGIKLCDNQYGVGRVMQFIGLKDKNGRDIYEGDIVRCVTADGPVPWHHKGAVEYLAESASFAINVGPNEIGDDDNPPDHYTYFWCNTDFEVVGNIYEGCVSDQSVKPGAGNPARTCSGERDPKGDAQEEKPQ